PSADSSNLGISLARCTQAELTLTFDRARRRYALPTRQHLIAAIIDVCGLLAIGTIASLLTSVGIWTAIAAASLFYLTPTTSLFGRSPPSWYLKTRSIQRPLLGTVLPGDERSAPLDLTAVQAPVHVVRPATHESGGLLDPVFLVQ